MLEADPSRRPGAGHDAIFARGVDKTYRVVTRSAGLRGAIGSFLRPRRSLVRALSNVDLRVRHGEICGLIGPNGAGKSSLLKILSGIMPADEGDVRVLGTCPWRAGNAFKRRISMIMGMKSQLLWDLPAEESFRLHRALYGIERGRFAQRLDELVSCFGVQSLLRRPVRGLSLGQRMRLELVSALLHEPELILMDEPMLGIDLLTKQRVLGFVRDYCRDRKATVLYTSHAMDEIKCLCRRTVLLADGRILYDGSLDGLAAATGGGKVLTVLSPDIEPQAVARSEVLREAQIEGDRLVVRLSREALPVAQRYIHERFNIQSMTVTDPSIEEVVTDVFEREAGHAG